MATGFTFFGAIKNLFVGPPKQNKETQKEPKKDGDKKQLLIQPKDNQCHHTKKEDDYDILFKELEDDIQIQKNKCAIKKPNQTNKNNWKKD